MSEPRVELGTKAETLARLRPVLRSAYVLPMVSCTCGEWGAARAAQLAGIRDCLGAGPLIVRSSARNEDTLQASRAGAFLSVADVDGANPHAVAAAVEQVIASYDRSCADDQVLVQTMLRGVRLAGVLFSHDLTTLAPYRTLNYETTGSTSEVTSGAGGGGETYVRFHGATAPYPSPEIEAAITAGIEIEGLVGPCIEIELAVDADGRVCVFQCRPMASNGAALPREEVLGAALEKAADRIEQLSRPHPHLLGARSVFGVMPDWNPAEIIGARPRMLALSLYKEVITDAVWSEMRESYGYRDLRSFPLLVSILGVPYIDVRVSFNSFVPQGVPEPLAAKLVNYYLDRLVEHPEAHDKVEFDIVFSCFYPGVRAELARLADFGFTAPEIDEIVTQLRRLTRRIVDPVDGFWRRDLANLEVLDARRRRVLESSMSPADRVYWLLEDCKRYGTLPFSGLARAGFVAMQFLRGLVQVGIITRRDQDEFLGSLCTVARKMGEHRRGLASGTMEREEFLALYGHLRPGTYDILSRRYDDDFDCYFGGPMADEASEAAASRTFEFTAGQRHAVTDLCRTEGLEIDAHDLLPFMRAAIEGREHAKLVFSRSLSHALVELERFGAQCGLDRQALSHLDVRTVLHLYSKLDAADVGERLRRDIEANRAAWETTTILRLPDLIVSPDDLFHFHLGRALPNFVTQRRVEAEVVREADLRHADLRGRIVSIRSADPGWDWIFAKGVAGFITQFGGANSHMAIRAAELRLAAVIGCGERNFEAWSAARRLEIDCANCTVRVIA